VLADNLSYHGIVMIPATSKIKSVILLSSLIVIIGMVAASNFVEQRSVDNSKIPQKLEESRGFQRWITNIKNKGFEDIKADEFTLKEENEIYNTKWIKIYSADDPVEKENYERTFSELEETKFLVLSPSKRLLIDIRSTERAGYLQNEARVYGQLDDKIIDSRILDCSLRANCVFDRAWFLENDLFAITEFSRDIDKKDETAVECTKDQECSYTFKVHLIDMKHNKRWTYESPEFNAISNLLVPEL